VSYFPEVNRSPSDSRNLLRFAVVLLSCFAICAILYFVFRRSDVLEPFLAFNARVSSFAVRLFGGNAQADGVFILSGRNSFQVITECTSLIPTAIFVSAVVAWQSSFRDKLIGLGVGIPLLFVINIARIISLLYVGSAFPNYLDIAHFYVWQALLIIITVGLWVLWAEKIAHSPSPRSLI